LKRARKKTAKSSEAKTDQGGEKGMPNGGRQNKEIKPTWREQRFRLTKKGASTEERRGGK